eukprot:NODE_6105_length_292_cov_1.139918_g5493_i0.p4 GENE.NODE_6105_length_292_cov_1.139918_g5493_i0~~NODE_6105_length_292_cov_1.139918_g5493_i0.p4  ORF type:complete len:65 (+),score=6.43 NODE_6105_length_292_cov_1.139918_g5493_i0:1-195(+)
MQGISSNTMSAGRGALSPLTGGLGTPDRRHGIRADTLHHALRPLCNARGCVDPMAHKARHWFDD